jgi:hypothetical protein
VNAQPVLGLTVMLAVFCVPATVAETVPLVAMMPPQVVLVGVDVRVTVLVPSEKDQFDTAPPFATQVVDPPRVTLLQDRAGGGGGGASIQAIRVSVAAVDEISVV